MFCIIPFYSSFLLMIKLTANLSHLFAGNSYNKLNNWEVEDSKKKKTRLAWEKLNTLYANRSRSHVMSLKERLTATTRGSSSVGEFLNTMRSISDEL